MCDYGKEDSIKLIVSGTYEFNGETVYGSSDGGEIEFEMVFNPDDGTLYVSYMMYYMEDGTDLVFEGGVFNGE